MMENSWYHLSVDELGAFLKERDIHIPLTEDLTPLAQPLQIAEKSTANRIAVQPMEGCDGTADGTPGELTERRYMRFAGGGAGLIWFEATAVCPEGRANPRQLMLTRQNADSFKRLVDKIHQEAQRAGGADPLIILQATHSGRYSKPDGTASPIIACRSELLKHQEVNAQVATDDYLASLPEMYAQTARLAREAGFDGVDVKACHRYLLSELFAAYNRPGKYGGSYENRTRLMKECTQAVLAEAGPMLTASRMNIYDGYDWPEGWGIRYGGDATPDMTEPIRLIRELHDMGMTLVDLTLGNPYFNPHVNRPFDQGAYTPPEHPLRGVERACALIGEIRRAVPQMKVIASALSYMRGMSGSVGAAMIASGCADMVGYGRMAFAYPDFARDLLVNGTLDPQKICLACSKCTELMRSGSTPGCVIRDPLYTKLYQEMKHHV